VRAVNLLPGDYRRVKGTATGSLRGPGFAVVAALLVVLGLVTLYVVTSNSVTDQKSKLASLQRQLPQVQALAAQLGAYTQFASLAQTRAQTVSQIASGRFDWAASMRDLAKVVPANTSLQSLSATAGTGPSAGSSTSSGSSGIRGALPNPAFELRGCTGSQDDVARLMSRLRLMNGVTRVTLSNASKQGATAGTGAPTPTPGSGGASGGASCGGSASSFDLVVFFNGPASATPGAPGASAAAQPVATQATSALRSASTTPTTSGTPSAPSAPATSASPASTGSHP
jgi:Tfp pilus assembly protein PilN